jgi:hypothetical protein
MKRALFAAALWSFVGTPYALAAAPSAARFSGESFEEAATRHHAGLSSGRQGDTAYDLRVPLAALDPALIPQWSSRAAVDRAFTQIREARFVFSDDQPAFARRSSWLYPDDGCFARAALAADNLKRWGFEPVAKIFAFGDLEVHTANSPEGHVEWWYHIAPIVRLGADLFVLDPAIDPAAPLTLRAWLASQTNDVNKLTVAVCNAQAYDPDTACREATDAESAGAVSDQRGYLRSEWARQVALGRDPTAVLGESPVWRQVP